MRKLDKLTAEQEARFGEFVERWTAIGLCTDPADRPRAEEAIREAYKMGGRELPEKIVWCGSPLGQALTRAIVIQNRASVGASVRASVRDSVGDSVGDSVWASVRASVRDSVRASVRDSVWASVGDSVGGQHEAPWIAFYAFFREACGLVAETDKLVGLRGVTESAGWWLPHEKICWVSERHNVCSLDDEQRIHAEDGPAIAYPDGWAIWAWHGVRVPQKVIEQPLTLTPEEIRDEQNQEVRRVMLDRFGTERFLREVGAALVHEDEFGKLWAAELRGDEPLVMVEVVNSTPEPDGSFKDYWLRVPPSIRTAREAVAWTFDVPGAKYELAAES